MHTKCILKTTLTIFNFDKKPARVSFSVAQMCQQLLRHNSIVFIIFSHLPNTPFSPSSSYYYYSSLNGLQPNQSKTYSKNLLNYLENIHTQLCEYLKAWFCNMGTRYGAKLVPKRSRSHESAADAHPQNSPSG